MINKVILVGNVGRKPEQIKSNNSDLMIAKFSLATNEWSKDKGETTQWFNIKCFRYTAEKALKLDKGYKVWVEGKIKQDQYTDKDGNSKQSLYVVCDTIRVISKNETIYNNKSNPWGGPAYDVSHTPKAKPEITISDDGYKMPF